MKLERALSIFGARLEAIKMAPVVKVLEKYPDKIMTKVNGFLIRGS